MVVSYPFLYGWSIVGIDTTIAYIIKRLGKSKETGEKLANLALALAIGFATILSGKAIVGMNTTWNQDYQLYQKVGKVVARDYRENRGLHSPDQLVVMAGDSADYYYATGQHAVLLPAQSLPTVLDAARRYSVSYILFASDQGQVESRLWRNTLTDRRLKLIKTWPSGKLYRFVG
jgi:hypothetical protein